MLLLRSLIVFTCLSGGVVATVRGADRPDGPISGREFELVMERPLALRADDIPLRPLLFDLARTHRITVLIDRRVDPNQPVSWKVAAEPFLEAVTERVAPFDCTVRVIGGTLVIGPDSSLGKLRTLIGLRREELQHSRWPATKRRDLFATKTIEWEDATEPRELLTLIAKRWDVTIQGLDEIPYDLMAGGRLTGVNGVEALSVVLNQFDRTFAWTDKAGEIRIAAIPDHVEMERRFRLKPATAADTMKQVAELVPKPDTTLTGQELVVRGTAETLDDVADIVNPRKQSPSTKGVIPRNVPLSKRSYTLTARQVPVREALKKVEESGITVDYDPVELREAGIDLNHRISLELKKASFAELMQAICEPVGLKYEVEGLGVTITPK
jgi:hypothetical protein